MIRMRIYMIMFIRRLFNGGSSAHQYFCESPKLGWFVIISSPWKSWNGRMRYPPVYLKVMTSPNSNRRPNTDYFQRLQQQNKSNAGDNPNLCILHPEEKMEPRKLGEKYHIYPHIGSHFPGLWTWNGSLFVFWLEILVVKQLTDFSGWGIWWNHCERSQWEVPDFFGSPTESQIFGNLYLVVPYANQIHCNEVLYWSPLNDITFGYRFTYTLR